jgi:hypothetical protein
VTLCHTTLTKITKTKMEFSLCFLRYLLWLFGSMALAAGVDGNSRFERTSLFPDPLATRVGGVGHAALPARRQRSARW